MRIINKVNGATYESKTMVKEDIYYVDRLVNIDDGEGRPVTFRALEDGWEEVKETETEWHDLRKDPTDVPNNVRDVWVCFIFPNKKHYEQAFYTEGVWRTMFAVDCDPIAWCELPKPKFEED